MLYSPPKRSGVYLGGMGSHTPPPPYLAPNPCPLDGTDREGGQCCNTAIIEGTIWPNPPSLGMEGPPVSPRIMGLCWLSQPPTL